MPTILVSQGYFLPMNFDLNLPSSIRICKIFCIHYFIATTHSAPMCSKLALHPERRWEEPWRYLTYGLVHKDYSHLLKNIAGLAMAGMILEYYHKSWRVFLVYAAGVVVGGIGRINPVARKTPLTPLVGSSGKQKILEDICNNQS